MKVMILMVLSVSHLLFNIGLAQLVPNELLTQAVTEFSIENSQIKLEVADPRFRSKADIILPWVQYSAFAVKKYYGKFPVKKFRLQLIAVDGDRVTSGHAYGGEYPLVEVFVGIDITREKLKTDWVMVHEMTHLALAELPRRHHWLVEGLAVYIESVARVNAGQLSKDIVWKSFVKSMPKGLPKEGDQGLDFTPTWGRRYWGGALFCLLADIKIRQKTNNRFSLQDAMRGILEAGYSMNRESNIQILLKQGDQATGQDVLMGLYQQMKAKPVVTNLPELWQSLGVSLINGKIKYDNDAPFADLRSQLFHYP